jgi:hypothetical protein
MDDTRPILYGVSDYAQVRKKNDWFGKSLPAIAAALLPVVAAATPLPPFEDSALAPDLRKVHEWLTMRPNNDTI